MVSIFVYYKEMNKDIITNQINYQVEDNSTYDVYYSGSNIINGKTYEQAYIRQYTNKIDFNFNYTINYSDKVSGTEECLAKINMLVYAPNSEVLIYKSDTDYIIPSIVLEFNNTNKYNFNQIISINYKKYLQMYEQFKDETSIISNATIHVEFITSSIANKDNLKDIVENNTISYDIPLSDSTYAITKTTNIPSEIKSVKKYEKNDNRTKYIVLISISTISIILLSLIIFIRFINNKNKIGYYKNKLNKILKTYNNIMVNVKKIPSLNNKNKIYVTNFEDLLDVQMEVGLPINYCETKKGQETEFAIIKNDITWIYILKKEEEENDKE